MVLDETLSTGHYLIRAWEQDHYLKLCKRKTWLSESIPILDSAMAVDPGAT